MSPHRTLEGHRRGASLGTGWLVPVQRQSRRVVSVKPLERAPRRFVNLTYPPQKRVVKRRARPAAGNLLRAQTGAHVDGKAVAPEGTVALCLSNGHGEDLVAAQVLRALYQHTSSWLHVDVLPLVGIGSAYMRLAQELALELHQEPATSNASAMPNRVPSLCLLQPRATLPSGGFIYARPWALLRDIAAGLFRIVIGQWRRSRYWLHEKSTQVPAYMLRSVRFVVLAVGDVWPLFLAVQSGVQHGVFIGTAKSDLYLQSPAGEWLFMQPYPHRWTSDRWVYGLNTSEASRFCLGAAARAPGWHARLQGCWRFLRLLLLDVQYAVFMYRRYRIWRAPFFWRLARLFEALLTGSSVYLPWERWLMRRLGTAGVYVRDQLTARNLSRLDVPRVAPYALNPMLDDLTETADIESHRVHDAEPFLVVAVLPGSRAPEAYRNWERMLNELEQALTNADDIRLSLEVPVASTLDCACLGGLAQKLGWRPTNHSTEDASRDSADVTQESTGEMLYASGGHRLRFWSSQSSSESSLVTGNPLKLCLQRADLVFACAGTATEQAVGLGKPVITSPGRGPQFTRGFWEAQGRLLGPSVILADPQREHGDAVSKAVLRVCSALRDTAQRASLCAFLREQAALVMGQAGAADYIAQSILQQLDKNQEDYVVGLA